jgi:hypothetical protein
MTTPFVELQLVVFDVFLKGVSSCGVFAVCAYLKGIDGVAKLDKPLRLKFFDDLGSKPHKLWAVERKM